MISEKDKQVLREQYNPEGSSFRCSQLATFEVLKYIKKICEDNNIKYWIACGTLLGAIRHKGFIPWDDDVDIEVPIHEINKLKKAIIEDNTYDWHDNSTDPHYWQRYPKIKSRNVAFLESADNINKQIYTGCFVDVFPVERMPDKFVLLGAILLPDFSRWHNSDNKFKLSIANVIYKFGSYATIPLLRLFAKMCPRKYFHHSYGIYFPKRRIISSEFSTTDVEFEGVLFKAPKDYESYLTTLYGPKYMELPPDKMRVNHSK